MILKSILHSPVMQGQASIGTSWKQHSGPPSAPCKLRIDKDVTPDASSSVHLTKNYILRCLVEMILWLTMQLRIWHCTPASQMTRDRFAQNDMSLFCQRIDCSIVSSSQTRLKSYQHLTAGPHYLPRGLGSVWLVLSVSALLCFPAAQFSLSMCCIDSCISIISCKDKILQYVKNII